ncbi:hypothetical protein N7474_008891 [Penicillium riverlandense]|uniref:uncharacterized protein n=1 Tax=Penicillium riverlandense TaxID=1903569 RepID=UPI002547F2ED|nr:uncharacterized protein N7474_008891 [Penicillium riverlandense]KAJ5812590.1 hypothetical protein N7474_008891 [Penicillium riverlandense]
MSSQPNLTAFKPISPTLDVQKLIESTPKFDHAWRLSADSINDNNLEDFERLVLYQVVIRGRPLVVEGFHKHLNKSLFSEKWLRETYHKKHEVARDLSKGRNMPLTIGHYLKNMPGLTDKMTAFDYANPDRQRIYLKDIDCPPEWRDYLSDVISPSLFYLNESRQKNSSGPGSSWTPVAAANDDPIARAGDLMSSLPPEMRAENLMCYIGHEGTYTPAHQEMCASLGHNLMVEASDGSPEYGKATKSGSSIWFMTKTKDRHVVSEYWLSILKHDIDLEDHFAQLDAWKNAPFKTYIVEQKPGDFILIPPLAAHQVWNRGTRTMKVAWNRTTVDTLEMALAEALPLARMVGRDEQYKNKAIVYFSLVRYSKMLHRVDDTVDDPEAKLLWRDFQRLFVLYTSILLSETFSQNAKKKQPVELIEFDSNITCSYCRCNIFNRFLTCPYCVLTGPNDAEDNYDVCLECYVMGRSCACISRLKWVEQFNWQSLIRLHDSWRRQILAFEKWDDAGQSRSPSPQNNATGDREALKDRFPPWSVARVKMGKKSLAEICQEQLKLRPWNDPSQPAPVAAAKENRNSTVPDSGSGRSRKRRKLRPSLKKDEGICHVCREVEPAWKLASCGHCGLQYCYGTLFRAFDIHPQQAMEKYRWLCPKCQNICSCSVCREDPATIPYEPRCLLPGHDTHKVADFRSVESLVNFRVSNSRWLKQSGSDYSRRIAQRQQEAQWQEQEVAENGKELQNRSFPTNGVYEPSLDPGLGGLDEIPVDPALFAGSFASLDSPVSG